MISSWKVTKYAFCSFLRHIFNARFRVYIQYKFIISLLCIATINCWHWSVWWHVWMGCDLCFMLMLFTFLLCSRAQRWVTRVTPLTTLVHALGSHSNNQGILSAVFLSGLSLTRQCAAYHMHTVCTLIACTTFVLFLIYIL